MGPQIVIIRQCESRDTRGFQLLLSATHVFSVGINMSARACEVFKFLLKGSCLVHVSNLSKDHSLHFWYPDDERISFQICWHHETASGLVHSKDE